MDQLDASPRLDRGDRIGRSIERVKAGVAQRDEVRVHYSPSMTDQATADRPILREVRESDIEFFYEYQADPEAAAIAAFTPRDREAAYARWREIMANDAIVARALVVGDVVAGHLVSWVEEDGHREVGYWIGREFWGRGIATAALRDFLEMVPYRPLEAWVAPHNSGSMRVLEKNGFTFDRDEEDYRVFRLG